MPGSCAPETREFLFATWEGGGSVTPALTAARRLLARGHRVRFMSDACNRPETEAAGLEFVPWQRAPSRPDKSIGTDLLRDWEESTTAGGFARLRDAIMCGPALGYALDTLAELERRPAELLVGSEMLFGVMVAAEARSQPLALLAVNLSIFPLVPGLPPFGAGLAPARDEADRQLHAEVAAAGEALFAEGLPAVNAARSALGLPPLAGLLDQLAAAGRILLATSSAFDFPTGRLPERLRYVGPQLGEPPWAEPWVSPWPAGDPRPLVLVAFSTSFQDQTAIVQRTIDALAGLPVRGLVTLGPALPGDALHPAANVVIRRSAPHDAVMREASLVVCHGGHGTVTRALSHCRPLLCVPMGRDQDDNAVRVVTRGAGLSLPVESDPATIRSALRRLLEEPGFRAAAETLGAAVAAEATAPTVVDELEALAGTPSGAVPQAAVSPAA
ncbi:glycosyltransferase [Geminicoccaceae bacterium 1502E]|nr:glycosyltransferase [Geminicoccaceae bacterium 1502E]